MRRRRNGFIRLLGVLFTFGCVAILAVAGAAGFLIWQAAGSLPDYKNLADYKPAVMTRCMPPTVRCLRNSPASGGFSCRCPLCPNG